MTDRTEIAMVRGTPIRYRVRRSPRARRTHISVSRREGVVVVLPRRAAHAEATALLAEVEEWLVREVARHGVADGPVRRAYATGSMVPVLGRTRRLVVEPLPPGRRRARGRVGDDRLVLELPVAELLDPKPALERFLRGLARRHLGERVAELSARIGLTPGRILVGERVTRWGSCSPSGTLSFCYRLVMAPPEVVDAVVAHELCHLRHLNHGRRFQRLLTLSCPGHETHMRWLRDNEAALEL
jgi:predicted metal-dependent hydrolase